jgi:hypothetical protein
LQAGDSAGSQASGNWQFIKSRQAGDTQALSGLMNETMQHQCVAHAQKRWHFMKAKKFEQAFDDGVDFTASLDWSKAKCAAGASDNGHPK